jgi:hypothetical protein
MALGLFRCFLQLCVPGIGVRYKTVKPLPRPQSPAKRIPLESSSQAGAEQLQLPPVSRICVPVERSRRPIFVGPFSMVPKAIHFPPGEIPGEEGPRGTFLVDRDALRVDEPNCKLHSVARKVDLRREPRPIEESVLQQCTAAWNAELSTGGAPGNQRPNRQNCRRSGALSSNRSAWVGAKRWSGRPDSNRGPPAPKAGALPGCATPRHDVLLYSKAVCALLPPGLLFPESCGSGLRPNLPTHPIHLKPFYFRRILFREILATKGTPPNDRKGSLDHRRKWRARHFGY